MSEKKKHRFPQSGDYVMTEATTRRLLYRLSSRLLDRRLRCRPDRLRPRHHHDGSDCGFEGAQAMRLNWGLINSVLFCLAFWGGILWILR